ncbi:UDP-glucose:glycoprotein glucosyltransferase 1-like [Petromyzon marinus]|uniref:UDP-glucose:glycoprotein glucosyltransferase 1-like n=1 Tax=Petromyzon marinus TaxID=7757 RepID=UPI003F6E9F0C
MATVAMATAPRPPSRQQRQQQQQLTPLLLLLAVLLLAGPVPRCRAATKGVTTTLDAKWSNTPLLIEASEFIAEESNEKFWNFVDTVQDLSAVLGAASEQSYYSLLHKKAAQFLTPLQQNLLRYSLAMRTHSATVQMFQQIAAEESPPEDCAAFVVIHGLSSCSADGVKKLLQTARDRPAPYLYKADHRYPSGSGGGGATTTTTTTPPPAPALPVAVLYGEVGSAAFSRLHRTLADRAASGELLYVLRHYVQKAPSGKVRLSGYGVELAIKSTEYKAKDDAQVKDAGVNASVVDVEDEVDEVQGFLFGKLKHLHPDMRSRLDELRSHMIESTNEMSPLKVWQMQDLSFQAAARIVTAPKVDALKVMKDISQNFPTKARSLTKTQVSPELRKEIEDNQKYFSGAVGLQPGESALFINGLNIDLDIQDPFSVLELLRVDARLLEGLHALGVEGEALPQLLLRLSVHQQDGSYALDTRSPAVLWVNDVERDGLYSSWPGSVQELLRPTFPGVMRQIRKNFFSLVLVLDPLDKATKELLKLAEMFYQNHVPVRLGLVFVVSGEQAVDATDDAGVFLVRAFNFAAGHSGNADAFGLVLAVYDALEDGASLSVPLISAVLAQRFPALRLPHSALLAPDSEFDEGREAGVSLYRRSGLGELPQVLFNGVPYATSDLEPDDFETATMQKIMEATAFFQRAVYMGELTNQMSVVEFVAEQPNVVPRFNQRVLSTERRYLDLTSPGHYSLEDFPTFTFLDSKDKSGAVASSLKYLAKTDEQLAHAVTLWVVADLDEPAGRELLHNAVKHMRSSAGVRVGVVNCAAEGAAGPVGRAVWAALDTQSATHAKNFVAKAVREEAWSVLRQGGEAALSELLIHGMEKQRLLDALHSERSSEALQAQALYCHSVLHVEPSGRAVVCNGRVVGPLAANETFNQEDFQLLEKVTRATSADKILAMVQRIGETGSRASDLVMKVDSLLSAAPKGDARSEVKFADDRHSVVKLRPREKEVYFDVLAIVDPVTRDAQRLAPLLAVLSEVVNVHLRLFMNCKPKLSEMPLKSFYRYVLEADVTFTVDGRSTAGPSARFVDLPQSPLLTLNMMTPEGWLVESVRAAYDLDNIYMEEVPGHRQTQTHTHRHTETHTETHRHTDST